MEKRIFSVSEINNYIKGLLDSDMLLDGVFIRGELSNYKVYPSGHHYFTMKDLEGAIRCVMFKGSASRLRFKLESGMKVIAFGRISVYPRDGAYQLYVNELQPDGVGDLYTAFEQLKEKLDAEGLFSSAHKRELPVFPARIAVVTSPAGAAVRDIIRVLGARWPMAKVIILPVRVQGTEAPGEIAEALRYANEHKVADLIITGRGGGSIEDLWAFNDEGVARAIFASEIPVISAVGHEPDVTISDFVADLRAATPSNAAELAVPDQYDIKENLALTEARLCAEMSSRLEMYRHRIEAYAEKRALKDPMNFIADRRIALDTAQEMLAGAMRVKTAELRREFAERAAKLDAMSPLKVLSRGYAIAERDDGRVIRSKNDVKSGDKIKIRVREDTIGCTVD
ncbi:MAG: exodeoxyribonuclease VII large subunit [Oscillospiraceae bacterium]|nr:exodeoxyribonuclease VII large subunit [Oscillospiraceae bacterium]